MENRHKIGFIKKRSGVMHTNAQRKELELFGCMVHEDIEAAIGDIRDPSDLIVVISPAILGYKIPDVMAAIHERGATLYSLASHTEYDCAGAKSVSDAMAEFHARKSHIMKERPKELQGGRPSKLSSKDKTRIIDLRESGALIDDLADQFDVSTATIRRVLK